MTRECSWRTTAVAGQPPGGQRGKDLEQRHTAGAANPDAIQGRGAFSTLHYMVVYGVSVPVPPLKITGVLRFQSIPRKRLQL